MILLVGGEKGGSGKTTTAINIAVYLALSGKDVLIVDADIQGTATKWVARRNEYQPDAPKIYVSQQSGNIMEAIKDFSGRYDEIIIDAGGRDSVELRSAMVACQKCYVPLRPSQFDLETSVRVNDLIKMSKALNPNLQAKAVITQTPTNNLITERKEATELLSELDEIELSDYVIYARKLYRQAATEGLGVIEMKGKGKAEIQLLCQEIYEI